MPTATEKNTAKKTTNRKPKTKSVETVQATEEVVNATSVVEEIKPEVKNVARKYERDDLIPCRSVTAGYLGIQGQRTKQPYPFENMGDTGYIEFQDLNSWLASHHPILFEPFIIIEDEELLSDVRWAEVRDLYDSMYSTEDAKEVLNLPINSFKEKFPKLPLGLKNAVKSEVVKQIGDGTFDSFQKVKIIDDVCGTAIGSIMVAE